MIDLRVRKRLARPVRLVAPRCSGRQTGALADATRWTAQRWRNDMPQRALNLKTNQKEARDGPEQ